MNSEEFKCVFCKESFDDKEALQIHFRKHGDKNFRQTKSRPQDEVSASSDKPASSKEQAEMVECDICPEVFTSISKAITHKHKVHPDHDAKYFCPWCGKLFTMKHLYNKHISTDHLHDEKSDDVLFHCDSCDVDFNMPAAVVYHNKFFHRIQDLPTIGNSKKLKMICQEAVPIHYCPFCGEEYDNYVNLHKHMTDEHIDENQHPDDVLRCPVCDALFYHLDAYELHLTYHSIDDLYSERSEIMDEITDFSLEAVPPIAEKVETLEPQGEKEEGVGIEQLFELTMDDAKHKKKKHKKHKKSKKEAITLDQFFNMNKDVFGEGIDFHGIEEVPTQVITKRLKKPIKKPTVIQSKLPPNIEKLKRQGIVIKKKVGTIPVKSLVGPKNVKPSVKATQVMNVNPSCVSITKSSTLTTPDDVLTKLMNQNNSQIKIVKKPIESKNTHGVREMQQDINSPTADNKSPLETAESNGVEPLQIHEDGNNVKEESNKANDPGTENAYPNNTLRKNPKFDRNNDEEESSHSESIIDEEKEETESKAPNVMCNNTNLVKSYQQSVDGNNETFASKDGDDTDKEVDEEINKNGSLDVLKRLSHLIVKSVNQENKPESNKVNNIPAKDDVGQTDVSKIAHLIRKRPMPIEPETTQADGKEVGRTEYDKISHLIQNKPTLKELEITHDNNKEATHTPKEHNEISKIAHLIKNRPIANEAETTQDNDKGTEPVEVSKILQGMTNKTKTNELDNISAKGVEVDKIAHLIRNKPTPNVIDKTPVKEKVVCQTEVSKIAHLIKNKPISNDLETTPDEEKEAYQTEVTKIAHLMRNRPTPNELEIKQAKDKEGEQTDVNKIAHLIRNKPSPKEVDSAILCEAKEIGQTEVNKIAHLLRNTPSKVTSINKTSRTIVSQPKTEALETEDNNFDTDHEANEDNDTTNIEHRQPGKLASILNSPHLNIQPIIKTPIALPPKECPDDCTPKSDKSNADLLKHLKNVTAKPVGGNRTVNVATTSSPKSSPKLMNAIKKEPITPPVRHSKVIEKDIEIFNIDDSDSDEPASNCSKIKKSDKNEANKPVDVLKNIYKNVTIKSVNNHVNVINKPTAKPIMQEFDSDCEDDVDHEIHPPPPPYNSNSLNTEISSPPVDQKQSAINNVLRNLSKNITVKSGNTSPSQFTTFQEPNSTAVDDNDPDSETDSLPGRVKITEMENASDDEFEKADINDTTPQGNVNVQYPDDSNSGQDEGNDDEPFDEHFSDEDIESQITANSLKRDAFTMSKPNLDSLKHLSKEMVIKPSGQAHKSLLASSSEEIPVFAKSLSNQISIKNMKLTDNCNKQIKSNSDSRNIEQSAGRSMNKSTMNQKMSTNVVNKEVKTVKTIQTQNQTKTVIQEITTTVTKTIKTINQSMKQEVRNTAQSTPKRIQKTNVNQNFQGVKVGQATMGGPRIRNPGITPTRLIRPSNQLVPVRPRFSGPRQNAPRMSHIRPSTSGQVRPQIGAQIKVAPGVMATGKRPNSGEAPGHFSCFKKPKESLFPETEFSTMSKHDGESFSSSMQMSKSNFASTTKIVKGNSVVTSTQMKSEMSASAQQMNKLRNMSGLSIVKTNQANQSHVEEKSEVTASKRNTLDAIQRLQSQGLLVKKPRMSEESEYSNQSEHVEHSDDEFDS